MSRTRTPTTPTAPGTGGGAEEEVRRATDECPHTCPTMEIQFNETAETEDDNVRLHDANERPLTTGRIRATGESCNAAVVLTNPDGKLRFTGPDHMTGSVSLPDDGSWVDFQVAGEMRSEAVGDAVVEAHCGAAEGPLRAQAPITVCAITIASETELDYPADRTRLRLGVMERVTLTASNAIGAVNWSIIDGNGSLAVGDAAPQVYSAPEEGEEPPDPADLPTVEGNQVLFNAHQLEDETIIQAEDSAGCKTTITFDVDCNYLISPARLREVFTAANDARINALTRAFNESYEAFEMTTCLRRAHFFAQVLEEIGTNANPRAENMNYAATALGTIFSYFRRNPAEATLYGRTAGHPANQEAIGNRAYANRNGNGDIASGDGWAFRGRGFIQVTGRGNYQSVQDEIDEQMPGSGIDIMANPDEAIQMRGGLISAFGFWSANNINAAADGGSADANVTAVTRIVNRWTDSGPDRIDNFHSTRDVFHVTECPH